MKNKIKLCYKYRNLKKNGLFQEKKEEMMRKNELETKMTEVLENLKTRLLVE